MESINICFICTDNFDDNKCAICCRCGKRVCSSCYSSFKKDANIMPRYNVLMIMKKLDGKLTKM